MGRSLYNRGQRDVAKQLVKQLVAIQVNDEKRSYYLFKYFLIMKDTVNALIEGRKLVSTKEKYLP